MTKIEKQSDTLESIAFDTSKVVDQFRAFAEKGVEQSREAYSKLKQSAEEAQKTLETSFETARSTSNTMSLKAVAAMRANADASFSHIEALVGAKSLSEVLELQTAFLRKNIELAVEQAKDMQTVAAKAVEDLSQPVKGAVDKAMKELKVA